MVTKYIYQELLITKSHPAIIEKWPRRDQQLRKFFIQQDGAKNHIHEDDNEFNNALMEHNITAKLYTQVPNSPDVTLLDLGFFRAIQSFNYDAPRNKEELIQFVSTAYNNYPWRELNHTWLMLQCSFNQILLSNGDNNYNINYISKEKLECLGQLPDVWDVVEEGAHIFNSNTYKNDMNKDTNDEHTTTAAT